MRAQLGRTFDLMLDFNRAMSLDAVYEVLLRRCAAYGVTSVLAGIIPDRIVKPSEQPRFVVLGRWPEDWAARYFERQYVRRDPTIHHCIGSTVPLLWSALDLDKENPASRIMNEAREFRLTDGITIPQLTLDGVRIGVSFAGDRIDKSPHAIITLTVLASYAVARALQLRADTIDGAVPLSPRERECLRWVSEGKTAPDVALLIGVHCKTVEKHLATVRKKLGALNTPQAVAQGMRLGLL